MRDLPLNALRAFALVYGAGGIRPAARVLEVSHSAVSRHLKELEGWIGVALLEAGGGQRRLAFTPDGEALARAALASLEGLERSVAVLREARPGNAVTITTTASFAARWLLPRLPLLQAALPWIEVSVVTEQAVSDPERQGADFAVRMGTGPWAGATCRPLMDDSLFPVMQPALWERLGRPAAPDRLAALPLLHDRDSGAAWERWLAAYPAAGIDLRRGARFTSSDLVLSAAARGLGVALARGRLAADDLASGALCRPFGARGVAAPAAYWIVTPGDAPLRLAAGRVVDWLEEQGRTPPAPA